MDSSQITTLNTYVTNSNFLKQRYALAGQYNLLYDDVAAIADGKLDVSEATNTTLVASDSGKVFFIDAATSAATYILPTPEAGLTFKWIWVADCNAALVVKTADTTDTTGDMLRGCLFVWSATDATTVREASSDVNTLTLDDNLTNSGAGTGSWVEVTCVEDAVWFVTGIINSSSTGSAIFSDTD